MKAAQLSHRIGLISLEGYIVGRLVVAALQRVGRELNHQSFSQAFKQVDNKFNIDGFQLAFDDVKDNQGSDQVFLTRIFRDRVIPVTSLKLGGGAVRRR